MNAIAQRIATSPAADVETMAIRISREAPDLAGLNQKQLEQIARLVITQRLVRELDAKATLAGIDWQAEKEIFLANAGRTGSAHTRSGYRSALSRLDAWTTRQGINPLELTPGQADDFIYSLSNDGRAAASIRLDASAVSSFFSWLERRHAGIKNPFRGTKARPAKKAVKKIEIPTAAEVETMIRELDAWEAAAVSVMAFRGLRAGALPSLSLAGGRFSSHSKGKDIAGAMPPEVVEKIRAAGLPLRGPFAGVLSNTLEKRIARAIEKLHKAGKVQAAYSCHDLRHFYAITEYRKDKDIHRVSGLLGHASIQVTENYLRGLGETE